MAFVSSHKNIPLSVKVCRNCFLFNLLGFFKFVCQHGEAECQNNVIQACIIYGWMTNATVQLDNHTTFDIVNCLMGSEKPYLKAVECLKEAQGNIE